jgi:hypothetical protein
MYQSIINTEILSTRAWRSRILLKARKRSPLVP